jgi:hypothetical protein
MTVHELTREQIASLKQEYLCRTQDSVSYGELADADEIVPDSTIFSEYEGTEFTEDDFFC